VTVYDRFRTHKPDIDRIFSVMARRPKIKIENRTERTKLAPRAAPYGFVSIAKHTRLGYRRVKDKQEAGTWVVKWADGKGGDWRKVVGIADDLREADGINVLDFHQAAEIARGIAGKTVAGAPATWREALDAYQKDLELHDGNKSNATHVRGHLMRSAPQLLDRPVMQLTAAELAHWRNALIEETKDKTDGLKKKSSVVRLLKSARASLNHAADHDERIKNRSAWRVGLRVRDDDGEPVDRVPADGDVLRIVARAYADDFNFGLFINVAAETGARASQIARLEIADLKTGAVPSLTMPSSRKGKSRSITRHPVPISCELAHKLKQAAKGRAPKARLLTREGEARQRVAWDLEKNHKRLLQDPFKAVVERLDIKTTMYGLRHGSIVRSLLAGVPAALVAAHHDTSLAMLAKTYARYIADHAHDVARRGLLAPAPVAVPA
jgi:hypothetical protein